MIASQTNSAAPAAVASSPDSFVKGDAAAAVIPPPPPPPRRPAAPALPAAEEEEDEEVRLAMEMAVAAAQNPHLSPADLRKLVGGKNQQSKIVEQVQQKKEQMKVQEQEEATKRWNEKKERAWFWFKSKTESVQESVAAAKVAAAKKAEELQFSAEKQIYAEQIRRDPETREIRKRMKVFRKALKAQRLNGNRVETRHLFKRQRMEKSMIEATEKLEKTRVLFCETNYQVTEYAKAMMRASKKWKRKGTDEELKLEAQLCRNMHQMLALEKQKSKVKKSTREIKKYLQRCKSWLSDKQALCEMHGLTLNATASSMQVMYAETLAKQDKLIQRLKETDEFKDVDLFTEWDGSHFDAIPNNAGPAVILNALRGLPIRDSIRVVKGESGEQQTNSATSSAVAAAVAAAAATTAAAVAAAAQQQQQQQQSSRRAGKAPELFITARDDDSVNSELSDPDGGDDDDHGNTGLDGSIHSIEFEGDAPWMQEPEKDKKKSSPPSSGDLKAPPPPFSNDEAVAPTTEKPTKKDGKPAAKKKEDKMAAEEKKPADNKDDEKEKDPEAAATTPVNKEDKNPASSGDTAETVPSNESEECQEETGNEKDEEEEA